MDLNGYLKANKIPVLIRKEKYMKSEISVNKLIEKFTDMANRGTLLTERKGITQKDLLIQIIGTITTVAMEER